MPPRYFAYFAITLCAYALLLPLIASALMISFSREI